jgi:hypothetical protein
MNNIAAVNDVVHVLNEEGLQNDIVIVGSWAEYFYQLYLFTDYISSLKTMDIDFAIAHDIKKQTNLITALKKRGFQYFEDTLTKKSKFVNNADSSFEIEFLTTQGRNVHGIYCAPGLGIYAEALPYMELLLNNLVHINLNNNEIVTVPQPYAYVLHKLIINRSRKQKAQKDAAAVEWLLSSMYREHKYVAELNTMYQSLGKKQKNAIKETVDNYNIIIFWELVETVL